MGYIKHHTIVVVGFDERINNAHKEAMNIFNSSLVSNIVESIMNGYTSFFVAPDGSKEGWPESDDGDECRREFIEYLRNCNLDFVEVKFGGDDDLNKILNSDY